jgi:hypothetical protein
MPPPVRAALHRARQRGPRASIGDANLSDAPSAVGSLGRDYAALEPNAVAAHFPVPSAEVAARLVDLLLPRRTGRPNGDEAA